MERHANYRSNFLDRIRVLLTGLVILHHSAIMFGASGGWYLKMPTALIAERVPFTLFVSVNQAFFMGFFFLIAGYFSALSVDRKGASSFVRERLLRLGLPIVVYGAVIGPMTVALAGLHEGTPFWAHWWALTRAATFDIGPLWFAFALLLFSAAYLFVRALDPHAATRKGIAPGHATLFAAALATGLAAFALRLWMPVGSQLWSLQIGYFASYTVLFAAGCACARTRWLEQVGPELARPWRWVSWITIPLLLVYAVAAGATRGVPFQSDGGWTLPALAYAMWEPFVAWGIILSMLWKRRVAPHPSPAWQRWARRAYAAYIVHPPVVVALGLLLADVALPNSAKFAVAGSVAIVLSFALARVLLAVPGARRIV